MREREREEEGEREGAREIICDFEDLQLTYVEI